MKSRTSREIATYLTLASITIFSVMPSRLLAGPVGEQVEAGSANFTRNGNNTVIDVSTRNAIINYHSFNIGAQEYVRFNQLNAASRVLNRINGGSPTHIDGRLSANGQVYFVNPAGVMFGQGAIVDVAGIYAAAGHMNSADFLNGVDRFTNLTGDVSNFGTINSQFVALVGKRVINDGIIFAPGGVVTMVAGDEVVIGEKNSSIMVKVTGGDAAATDAAVVNTGTIDTGSNGQVALGAGDMYWLGVKQEATGSITGGDVVVDAAGSSVEISGTVDSTNATTVLADEIAFYTVGIGSGDVTLTGNVVTVGNISGAGAVDVLGTAHDDLMIIDLSHGMALPDGGLSFNAGGQDNPKPLGDVLELRGGTLDSVAYNFIDVDAEGVSGTVTLNDYVVNWDGFEPVIDTVVAPTIVINYTDGANAISITNAGAGGGAAETILVDDGVFESIQFANKTTATINGNLGAPSAGDTFTLNASAAADGLTTLNLNGSDGFADALTITAAPAGVTTTFAAGTGTDTVTGPNASNTWSITGPNAGSVAGVGFTGVENATGGSSDDAFTVDYGASLSGTLDGGAGGTDSATFDGDGNTNAFDINSAVADTIDVDGNATAIANIDSVTANGLAGDDSFVVAPSTDYTVTVDAGTETTADTFDLDTSALSDSPAFTPIADGAATFSFPADPTFMDVDYADVETLTMSGPHATFDIDILLANFGDDLTIQLNAAGTLLELNGSTISQSFTATLFESLTITGNASDNTVTINETAGGLPSFVGTATGSHTNAAFTGSGPNPLNVGIHFDGGAETTADALVLNFITGQTVSYFSDDDATANSGVINVDTAFSMSFEDLEPITTTGTGGTLNINTTANTLANDFVLENGTGIGYNLFRENPDNGGFESVEFGGFDLVDITVGNGSANSVGIGTPTSLDTAAVNGTALTQIDVNGGAEVTTVNVEQLPATITLNIDTGNGNDIINITPTGMSLASIAGAITIDGGLGDDTLSIDDTATAGDTTGTIDDATITGFGMPNGITNYTSITTLNFDAADAGGQTDSLTLNGAAVTTLNLDLGDGDDDVTVNLDNFGTTGQTLSLYGNAGTDALVVNGTAGNDVFVIQATGGNAEIDRNTNQQSIVYDRAADAADSFEDLTLNGTVGNDSITINNAGGFGLTQVADSVTLVSTNDAIGDSNDGGTVTDIATTDLTLTAADGIDLEIDVDTVTATNTTAGNIVLAEVDGLTALNINSQAGDVTLTANGAITDTDASTDLAGTTVNVTNTAGAMGSVANPIETAATNLNITNTAGNVALTEVDSLTSTIINAGGNDLYFAAQSGTINQAGTDDIVADEFSLTGTGNFALDGDGNNVNEIAATVTGNVTYVNGLNLGPVAVDAVTGGETGVTLTGGAFDITADGVVVNQNISATGVTITGRSDDVVTTTADTLIDINAVTINAGAGALTITGEDLAMDGATLDGTGAVLLQPVDVEDNIELGDADADLSTDDLFQIDDAEIAQLSDGFSGITIGRADGSHDIEVNSVTFTDPITIQSPVDGAGTETISIIGTLAGTGDASVTIDGAQATTVFDSSNPQITTEGQAVVIDDNVLVNEAISGNIDTTQNGNSAGAAITINGTVNGAGADTDGPTFADGDEERLIANAGSGGTVTLGDDVGTTADLILDLTGNTLALGAGITVELGNTAESSLAFNSINFNGATISGSGVVQFAPLNIGGNIAINSNTASAITFDLNATTVTTADDVTFADGFDLVIFGQSLGTGLIEVAELGDVTFTDSVHFLMNGAGGRIVAGNETVARSLISTANTGDGDDVLATGYAESINGYTFTGPGSTTTIFATNLTTAGLPLVFNDAVIIDSPTNNVRMDTTNAGAVATGADITFNGTLDADAPGNQSLELFSGTDGDILFADAVGASDRLGDVFIGDDTVANDAAAEFDFQSVTASDVFIVNSLTIKQFANDGGNVQFDQGIDTSGYTAAAIANSEAGGNVLINTDADGDNDPGGDVLISGTVDASASAVTGVAGEDAGDVTIIGKDVTLANILATGGQTDTATGGAGGTVTIDAVDALGSTPLITLIGSATPNEINTAGGTGPTDGAGGDVTIGDAATPGGGIDTIRITTDDYGISTGDTAGNITFDGFVDGAGSNDLVLTAGSQAVAAGSSDIIFNSNVFDLDLLQVNSAYDVTFNESVGYDATDVADAITNIDITAGNDVLFGNAVGDGDQVLVTQQLRIRAANDVTSNAPVIAGSILQDTGTGATTFNEAVTTNNASGISIATERAEFGDTLGDDTVTVNAAGSVVIAIDGTDTANVNPTNTLVINDNAPFVLNGGGSFTQQGAGVNLSVVELGADITTQGGGITFRDHVEANQNVTLSTGAAVGGNILFDQNLFALTDTLETVTLTAGSGNITVNGAVGTDPTPAAARLGQLLINNANITTFAGTVDVMDFTQLAGTGQTEFQGDVTVFQDFTNADVIDSTAIDQTSTAFFVRTSGNLFFNNADLAVREVTGGVGGANVVMQVGNAEFSGGDNTIGIQTAGGTDVGVLVIEPFSAGGDLNAGTGAGGIALSNTDVNALADGAVTPSGLAGDYGFARIFLGRSDGTGSISLNNAVTFHAPLYVRAPQDAGAPNIGNITIGGSGGVLLTDAGEEIVFDAHQINLGGTVTTNAGNVYFVSGGSADNTGDFIPDPTAWLGDDVNGASVLDGLADVTLVGSSTVDSTGGDIIFENDIDGDGNPGDFNLTLDAGGAADGDIAIGAFDAGAGAAVTGRVGGTDRIGDILITDAANVTFGGDGAGADPSTSAVGTGSINATSFTQAAGSGDTNLFGTADILGDGVATALRTGAYNDQDGGNVSIDTTGAFFTAGAIVSRGGDTTAAGGGNDGGFVDIAADTVEIQRIDTTGSNAVTSGDGGAGGTITLDAIGGGTDTIILHGDLLANAGTGAGGGQAGNAADVQIGDTDGTFDDFVTIAPDDTNAGAQNTTADTVLITGNDVDFFGPVNADLTDANGDSLTVNTFDNLSQTPLFGITRFHADLGTGADQAIGGGDDAPIDTLLTDAHLAAGSDGNGYTATVDIADEILVTNNAVFNDTFVVGTDTGTNTGDTIIQSTAGDVTFNSYIESLDNGGAGSDHGLTILTLAVGGDTTIAKSVGTDIAAIDSDDPADADGDGDTHGLEFLVTDDTAGFGDDSGQLFLGGFGDITIELFGGAATSATFNDQVVLDDSVTINSAGANGITFADLVDSIGAEANDLTVNTTGGETTTFVGAVGSGDISDLTGGVATNALGLGNLTTDNTVASGVGLNGNGTTILQGEQADGVSDGLIRTSADQTYNDAVLINETVTTNLTVDGVNVSFLSMLDEGATDSQDLTINASGVTQFGDEAPAATDAVGGITPLASLTTDAPGSVLDFADITTDGGTQTYNDPFIVAGDVTLTDTGTTGIFFNNRVDDQTAGTHTLNVVTTNAAAVIQFGDGTGDDRVGNTAALGELNVTVNDSAVVPGLDGVIIVRASDGAGNASVTTSDAGGGSGDQTWTGPVEVSATSSSPGAGFPSVNGGTTTFNGVNLTFTETTGGAGRIDALDIDGKVANSEPQTLDEAVTFNASGILNIIGPIGSLNDTDATIDDEWISDVTFIFAEKLVLQNDVTVDGNIVFNGLGTGRIVMADFADGTITLDTNSDDLGASGDVIMSGVVGVSAHDNTVTVLPGLLQRQNLVINTLSGDAAGGDVVLAGFDNVKNGGGYGGFYVNAIAVNASGSDTTAITGDSGTTTLTDDIALDDNALGAGAVGGITVTGNGNIVSALDAVVNTSGVVTGTGAGVDTADVGTLTIETEVGDDQDAGVVNFGDSNLFADGTVGAHDFAINTGSDANAGGQVDLGLINDGNGAAAFLNDLTIDTQGTGDTTTALVLDRDIFLDGAPTVLIDAAIGVDTTNDTAEDGTAGDGIITIDTAQTSATGGTVDLGGNAGGAITNSTIGGLVEGNANFTIDASAATTGGTVYLGAFGAGPGGLFINDLRVTTNGATDGTTFTMFDIQVDDNNAVDQADQASVTIEQTTFVLLDDGVDQTINIDTEFDGDASGATNSAPNLAGAAGYVDLERAGTAGDVVGLDLNIDTSATTGLGGAVDLGLFSNAGGAQNFVNDLTVTTSSGNATSGATTLHDDVQLDDDGAGDTGDFTIVTVNGVDSSTGLVVIAKGTGTTLTVDTEDGDDAAPGDIIWGNGVTDLGATIAAGNEGQDLALNTSTDFSQVGGTTGGAIYFGDVNNDAGIGSGNVATGGSFLNRLFVDTTGEAPTGSPVGTQGTPGRTLINGNGTGGATVVSTDPSAGPGASGIVMMTDLRLPKSVVFDTEDATDGGEAGGIFNIGLFTVDGGEFVSHVTAHTTDVNMTVATFSSSAGLDGGNVDLGQFNNDGFGVDDNLFSFVEDLLINPSSGTDGVTTLHHNVELDDADAGGADFEIVGDGDVVFNSNTVVGTTMTVDTNADIADDSDPSTTRGAGPGGEFTVNGSSISATDVNTTVRIFTGSDDDDGGQFQFNTIDDGTAGARNHISNLLVDTRGATATDDGLIIVTGSEITTRDGGAGPAIAGGDQVWLGPIDLRSGGTVTVTGNDVFFGLSSSTDATLGTSVLSADILSTPVEVDNTSINSTGNTDALVVNTESDLGGTGTAGNTLFGGKVGAARTAEAEVGPTVFTAAAAALVRVQTNANGTTFIGADINTIGGTQNYIDPVKLLLVDADAIATGTLNLTDTGSTGITFRDTLNSADDPDPSNALNLDVNLNLTVTDPGPGAQGDITFMDVVGGSGMRRLGRVQIIDANDVLAMNTFTAKALVQQAGTGNTEFNNTVSTAGAADALQDATDDDVTPNTFDTDPEFGIDAVGDGGDIIILTEGGIAFYNGATLDGTGAGAAGDFLVQPDVTGGALASPALGLSSGVLVPDDIVILGGTFSATGTGGDGDFYLSPMGRTGGKSVLATIRGASTLFTDDPGTANPNVALDGASVFIGEGEIVTVFGNLTMTASDGIGASPTDNAKFVPGFGLDIPGVGFVGTIENPDGSPIVHNDLGALENITINSAEIRYRRRPIGKTVQAFGPIQENDLGLDIIAGENIFYQVTPQPVTGTVGPEPIFANPGADFDVNNKLASFVGTNFDPVNAFQLRHNGPYPFGGLGFGFGPLAALDPSSNGPSNANSAEALAAVIPTPEQSGVVERETIVGDFQRELLAEFAGVDLEGLSPAQRLEFLTGRELYNDLPGVSPVKVAVARALLTENRLLYDPVANMLAFYRDFFLEQVINPETGQTELISRHIEHRRSLAAALEAYQQNNNAFTAESFAAFLIDSPNHGDAYRVVQGLKTLSAKFTLIGLTPLENSEAMRAVAERIAPEGMTADQLMAVTRAMPAADQTFDEPEMPAEPTGDTDTGDTVEE